MNVNENPQITEWALFPYLQWELASHARAINELYREVMPITVHSAELTADALVKTGPCVYYGYQVTTATAVANIQIRDATSAGSGTVVGTITSGTSVGQYPTTTGIICETGLYCDFTAGATGTVVLLFRPI